MGKKKNKEKVSGSEKTAQKTDRKADKKLKKELQKKGEDDIEKLIAEFQEQDRKRQEIVEEKCPPPSPRCNMNLTAHPERDELIMFGGEFFNGKLTYLYNDLYFYSIKNNDWTLVKSPGAPPPRCAHQAVAMPQDGGQLWVFGGEFASQTQSQFYHYKDLWLLSLRDKQWKKIEAPGGPTSRSGHRMVACKKMLIVFGGFHDNIRDYKYYNDVHAFSLESYSWTKLEISGVPPAPRSACVMGVTQDQNHIIIYGGYSKERVKKDVDIGKTHTDMFKLTVDSKCKQDSVPLKWRWQAVKQCGVRPSPRCGCSLVVTPGDRAIVFGGVFDEEEDEEEMTGVFYNDMYSLELDKGKWHEAVIRGKRDLKAKKKRRKKKDETGDVDGDGEGAANEESEEESSENDDGPENMEEDIANLNVGESRMDTAEQSSENKTETESDSIFTVTIGPQSSSMVQGPGECAMVGDTRDVFTPGPRMNCLLAVKRGVMYMYGGVYEVGDKQYTLSDMYSLDLHKLEQWSTLIACDLDLQDWQESDEGSDDDESEDSGDSEQEAEGATAGQGDMDDNDEDDDDDGEDMEEGIPTVLEGEVLDDYFSRCEDFWLERAADTAREEGLQVSEKQKKKAASRMAKEYYQAQCS